MDEKIKNPILYRQLQDRFPDLFRQHAGLKLITDEKEMEAFSGEKPLGVVFDNSPFYYVVSDLVENEKGVRFAYARVIGANADIGSGNIIIPVMKQDGQKFFGLLKIYRHSFRGYSLEFPRGFQDTGLSALENARKELREELGSRAERMQPLGFIRGDTGMAGGRIQVYLAEIRAYQITPGYEGIDGVIWVTGEELCSLLQEDKISCALTAAAYAKYLVFQK